MYLSKIQFHIKSLMSIENDDFEGAATQFLVSINRNGQIHQDWVQGWEKDIFTAYVNLVRPDSLQDRYACKYVKRNIEYLK